MLVALNNGKRVFASQAIRTETYHCPYCNSLMIPHLGKKVVHHFKHKPGANCPYLGESIEHMRAKEIVFNALTARGLSAELEAYVSTLSSFGNRIADILVTSPTGAKVAIELQRSNITEQEIHQRTSAYSEANISVLWIPFASPKLTKELIPTYGYCHLEQISPTPLMKWLEETQKTDTWLYEPKSETFWTYDLFEHMLYKEETDWGGGYTYPSKKWRDASFYGPTTIENLRITKATTRDFSTYYLASLTLPQK